MWRNLRAPGRGEKIKTGQGRNRASHRLSGAMVAANRKPMMAQGMNPKHLRKFLSAFADGELATEQNLRILKRMALDPQTTRRVMHRQQLRKMVRRAMDDPALKAPETMRPQIVKLALAPVRPEQPAAARGPATGSGSAGGDEGLRQLGPGSRGGGAFYLGPDPWCTSVRTAGTEASAAGHGQGVWPTARDLLANGGATLHGQFAAEGIDRPALGAHRSLQPARTAAGTGRDDALNLWTRPDNRRFSLIKGRVYTSRRARPRPPDPGLEAGAAGLLPRRELDRRCRNGGRVPAPQDLKTAFGTDHKHPSSLAHRG